MRQLLTTAIGVFALVLGLQGLPAEPPIVLDNARVRVFRGTSKTLAPIIQSTAAVVVPIADGPVRKAGEAYWTRDPARLTAAGVARTPDPAARGAIGGDDATLMVVVEPKRPRDVASDPSNLTPGSKPEPDRGAPGSTPGNAPFVGMSFRTLFENALVSVIRARMEVHAREGFHTHAADTIVVHLSGGEIEDTAGGKTNVNRWKPGDVEFEARGSSHSARNVGQAVDVVLVRLEP